MLRFWTIAISAALLLSADVSGVIHVPPPTNAHFEFPPSENLPVLPDMRPDMQSADAPDKAAQPDLADPKSAKGKDVPLQPESRLSLIRFIDGEYVRVLEPLPSGKNGFHLKAGVPLDEKSLRMSLGSSGSAVNPGDKAQITSVQFKEREIVVDINGGGRGKKRLRDRIHMEVGGMPTMTSTGQETAPVDTNLGATIYLDFDKAVPDMTADELKHDLSSVLDFSKQHSAAVQWMNTLPADIQNAIRDNRAAVGMDREMVLAAIGRPDRKVREKGADGNETEDWIYGKPPAKTVFVKFEGDKVTQVEQYPQ